MKKILTLIIAMLTLASCQQKKTPQEKLEEIELEQMAHERYIDSLTNVAAGLEGAHLRANRQHALDILKKEYPEIDWTDMQQSINDGEIY